MHLIVTAFGSYGDVLPMVGIGAAARARGHRVQAVANPYFRKIIEDAGLELLPLGTAEEYLQLTEHPDLWHPRRGLKLVVGYSALYLREVYRLVESQYVSGETVIAAHGLDLASRVLQDKCGAPVASVHFAPFALYTLHDTPRYIGVPSMTGWPRWLKRLPFYLGDKLIVGPSVAPSVNSLRAEVGLPPVSRIYLGWNQSPQLVLGMFPDWFGAAQPDWPPHTQLVGFPLWDPRPATGLPPEVEEFLQSGDAPIVFAPGSANVQAADFFRTAVDACERLGRRGLLATKYSKQLPSSLPPTIKHFGFVPFSLLLPRCAALVHHGGIGTCAQGLASGLPQIVMPMAYDQLDNGQRLERLGVGAVVPQRRFKPRPVADALAGLLSSTTVDERAAHWARQCNGEASLESACRLLEGLLTASRPQAQQKSPRAIAAHGP